MANSVDPDQTAPIGAVYSGSLRFASILNSSVMLGNYLQQTTSADDYSKRHFHDGFFLGALRGYLAKRICKRHMLPILGDILSSMLKFEIILPKLWRQA